MLTLHHHPLASYCWKVSVGLHETGAPFRAVLVDLMDPDARAAFLRLAPLGKFPVLVDEGRALVESTTILEHLARFHPGASTLVPADPDLAAEARALDRLFDLYVHEPMQKIVDGRLRPEGSKDPLGVSRAHATLETSLALLDRTLRGRTWAAGELFTIADCAAAPALHYTNEVHPIAAHPHLVAYLARLRERPSFARVLEDAKPYAHMFPKA